MTNSKTRYAVVGLGYFAQSAILPAFARAKNSELVALVSDDATKLHELGMKYEVERTLGYGDLDAFLQSGAVDAVYIALPNSMHCEYTVRAARAGVNVLCEKPMAVNEAECRKMIDVCKANDVRLMIAYRLHFEAANLQAVSTVTSGEIGEPRAFNSVFTMQVHEGNTRLRADLGGGPLADIGIYCINAARYLFRDEPIEVIAFSASRASDPRFVEVDEQVSAIMKFPHDRLATFVAGFGATDVGRYEVIGTKGSLRVDPAFEFAEALGSDLVIEGKKKHDTFEKRDQVAPEIIYFSRCIQEREWPEPSGVEGLADVRVMTAIQESVRTGRSIAIEPVVRRARPTREQELRVAPHGMPDLVHASPPTH